MSDTRYQADTRGIRYTFEVRRKTLCRCLLLGKSKVLSERESTRYETKILCICPYRSFIVLLKHKIFSLFIASSPPKLIISETNQSNHPHLAMPAEITKEEPGKVISDYILDQCAKHPDKIFLTQPIGDEVKMWTFAQFVSESKRMAAYIESLDLPVPSQIAIMSTNCAWWLMADLAIMLTGHVGVPIYPTLTAETTKYTLEHSESKLLFVGKLSGTSWQEMKEGIPEGMKCITFPLCPDGLDFDTWEELVARDEIKEVKKRQPEELATIIYTSGSTGMPKGVMLSFDSMTCTIFGLNAVFRWTSEDRYLSYLPLSHGMERWLGECLPFVTGMQVFYTDGLATFGRDLARCKPTLFVSVPRLWTKFQQGVFRTVSPNKLNTMIKVPVVKRHYKKKVMESLGFDCVRVAFSGSAPLPPELLSWYRALGLRLLEGYGMTENFNYSHVNLPGKERVGYVGLPQKGVQQRIAEDGELQIKSPGMMMGYYKNDEATSETFTSDFWLRTGDKGELDELGRLKITGRTKEIFKTSKGKYVAPAPIESMFISHPLVEMACVGGRGEPAAHVIILLCDESKKAAKMGGEQKDEIQEEMEALFNKVNDSLAEHEKMQFLVIVNEEWLPENGFVTPTNKIKRSKIEQEHLQYLDEWYESDSKVIWHRFVVRRLSLVNMMRNSVKSIETVSRSSLESLRSMSFKQSTANVSRKEMNKLHAIDKMSEMRDAVRDWLK